MTDIGYIVSIIDSDPFNYYGEKLRLNLLICYTNLKSYQTPHYETSEISNFIRAILEA